MNRKRKMEVMEEFRVPPVWSWCSGISTLHERAETTSERAHRKRLVAENGARLKEQLQEELNEKLPYLKELDNCDRHGIPWYNSGHSLTRWSILHLFDDSKHFVSSASALSAVSLDGLREVGIGLKRTCGERWLTHVKTPKNGFLHQGAAMNRAGYIDLLFERKLGRSGILSRTWQMGSTPTTAVGAVALYQVGVEPVIEVEDSVLSSPDALFMAPSTFSVDVKHDRLTLEMLWSHLPSWLSNGNLQPIYRLLSSFRHALLSFVSSVGSLSEFTCHVSECRRCFVVQSPPIMGAITVGRQYEFLSWWMTADEYVRRFMDRLRSSSGMVTVPHLVSQQSGGPCSYCLRFETGPSRCTVDANEKMLTLLRAPNPYPFPPLIARERVVQDRNRSAALITEWFQRSTPEPRTLRQIASSLLFPLLSVWRPNAVQRLPMRGIFHALRSSSHHLAASNEWTELDSWTSFHPDFCSQRFIGIIERQVLEAGKPSLHFSHRWTLVDAAMPSYYLYKEQKLALDLLMRLFCEAHEHTVYVHIDLLTGVVSWFHPLDLGPSSFCKNQPVTQWVLTPGQLLRLFLHPLLRAASV